MNDTTYSGVRINSVDKRAIIYFLCDSGSPIPRVMFLNKEFLGGEVFELAYRVDKGKKKNVGFWTLPNSISGWLYTNYSLTEYDKDNRRVINNLGMTEGVPEQFMDNFIGGTSALVRVWDYRRKYYNYEFDLAGLTENLDALRDCYPRP